LILANSSIFHSHFRDLPNPGKYSKSVHDLTRYAPRRAFKQIPVYTPENRKLSQPLRASAVIAGELRPQAFGIPKEDDWDGFSSLAQTASARNSSGSEVTREGGGAA
jgi:hypothetical protein